MALTTNIHHQVLQALYIEHHGWLNRWLRQKLGCPHSAADLAHDTFIKVLLSADIVNLKTPRAYLTTTATRLMIDQVRRQKVEQAYLTALAAVQWQDEMPSPAQQHEVIEMLTAIVRLLEGLPTKAKNAFLLSRLEGLSHGEIAVQLGVSSSMVKQYIASAMVHCYRVMYA